MKDDKQLMAKAPKGKYGANKIRVNVVLPDQAISAWDAAAKRMGLSRSELMTQIGLLLEEQPHILDGVSDQRLLGEFCAS